MRLSCPNCDACYEVDGNVIPKDGRDVQCSGCGKTWFQKSAEQLEREDRTAAQPHKQPTQPEPVPEQPQAPEPLQQPTNPDALEILREEAALEAAARKKDAQESIETQPDLGLDQSSDNQSAAATARMRGVHVPVDKNASPGDMLPDIEEINSSLRASDTDEKNTQDEETAPRTQRRSGFRMGFSLVVLLAVLALFAYIYAPAIIEKIPASQASLEGYVDVVNGFRLWLDQLMKSATTQISGAA